MEALYAGARRVAIVVAGTTLVLAGIVCIVLPGPGILLIFTGLAVLGTQLPWARRIHLWMQDRVRTLASVLRIRRARAAAPPSSPP